MLQLFGFFTLVYAMTCFGANSLSLEEKVGQLLMAHFSGEAVNEDARILVQEVKVGGIIYYNWANGLTSPEQVRTLSVGLQKLASKNQNPISLLIAADQEGGKVARLQGEFPKFPGNRAVAETGGPELAETTALAMGKVLRAVGINMNLAPVVDVDSNADNSIMSVRSFGAQPARVALFGEKALCGYKQAKIIATLKHFPGHGDVTVDSHEDLPVVRKSKEELERVELFPFAKLAPFADAIMTAHILVPALDVEYCATLSAKILGYLRETIGFQGVIVSDSLIMEGVIKQGGTVDEAAIRAIEAGCDLLILGGKLLNGARAGYELTIADVQRIHRSLVAAVKSGRISEMRLNQAVERILKLKQKNL